MVLINETGIFGQAIIAASSLTWGNVAMLLILLALILFTISVIMGLSPDYAMLFSLPLLLGAASIGGVGWAIISIIIILMALVFVQINPFR